MTYSYSKKTSFTLYICLFLFGLVLSSVSIKAQTISFGSTGLVGENLFNPTSLTFGPDGRLYVAQQNGLIKVYTVDRDGAPAGNGTYTVTATETITTIQDDVPNHNDDGTINTSPSLTRLALGIATAGTAANPILYVSSSDSRITVGTDSGLDTNSGVISRLTWNGSSWDKVDLVRGLPRCEENHATNAINIFERGGNTYLLVNQGGNTNKGAPSNNFSGTPEYMLSGSILIVNLTQLESMPVYNDPRTNTDYVYDLPTLNDPTRTDITNTDPNFPYPAGHPMYNASIDPGDPFGGNNSLNQAFTEPGGPVQIFSPGYRNAYDAVITESGRVYTSDNGPNTGWGGQPLIYDSTGTLKGTQATATYDPAAGDYIVNEINESASTVFGDPLHLIGNINDSNGTYYGGHPVPIRAFPSKAEVIEYINNGSGWVENSRHDFADLLVGTRGYFKASFSLVDFPEDWRQGEYLLDNNDPSKVNILDVNPNSTNGICEYTATNFGGVIKGNIITASFSSTGYMTRYELNATGDAVLTSDNTTFTGFGSQPLDVIAQGDTDPFPGTIWAATYGSNNITIFEPIDFIDCLQPGDPGYDPLADTDNDGFTNQDEIDNGTNHCSPSSVPDDNDGDFISDLNDDDDDNDTILDVNDVFALDANNGLTTNLPIDYPFWNNDPGTGLFGLGFTGLMLDPSGSTDYLTQFDPINMSFGGAAGKASVDLIPEGDALGNTNTQQYAFQVGLNVDTNSNSFTVHSKIDSPYFVINGNQTVPVNNQSQGIYIGTGDQDNYLKVVFMDGATDGDNEYGLQVLLESSGTVTSDNAYDVPNIINAASIDIYINVNTSAGTAQPYYSLDNGVTVNSLGTPILLPGSFLSSSDSQGMAAGIIATSAGPGDEFAAVWDFLKVTEDQPSTLGATPNPLDFGEAYINSTPVDLIIEAVNQGGPAEGPLQISAINITGTDASLFAHSLSLPTTIGPGAKINIPVTFTPNNVQGAKSATLEIIHNGSNSPLQIPLSALLSFENLPVVRINTGDILVAASDGGPDWENNSTDGATSGPSYSVNTGNGLNSNLVFANKHASIPNYIDASTFDNLFNKYRLDSGTAPEMQFDIPLSNGDYTVNVYLGNSDATTNQPGDRIFDILIESNTVYNNLDLINQFGDQVGGMLSFPVTLTDGVLNIGFLHEVNDPLVHAIEVVEGTITYPPLTMDPIEDQANNVNDNIDFFTTAFGGNPNENFTYSISGQSAGVDIEPTNGHIFGTVASGAENGGPAFNGIYNVTVTASKPGSDDVSVQFIWSVYPENYVWTDKNEDLTYLARHECSFVQAGDKFYLFGGREQPRRFDVYDYQSNTWTNIIDSAPFDFNHFQATEYQGLIWVIGAFKTNNYPNEQATEYIWAYNPANNVWMQGPEIPVARRRGAAGLVVYNDKFYIIAGNNQGHNNGAVAWFDEYDPQTGVWTQLADAPRGRDHFHAAVIGDKLYLASGRRSGEITVWKPVLPEVDVYDFNTQTWSTLPNEQNLPTPRAGASVVNFDSKLLVIGGEVEDENIYGVQRTDALEITEAFDPVTQTWTRFDDLNHKRHGTQAIVSGNGIHIAAGSPNLGGGNQKNMEFFGEDNPQGAPSVSSVLETQTNYAVPIGGSVNIPIYVTTGNTGVFVESIVLTGIDVSEFSIDSGAMTKQLLKKDSNHIIAVSFSGTEEKKIAKLIIRYDGGKVRTINLSSGSLEPQTLFRINAGGALTNANDLGVSWSEDQSVAGASGSANNGTPSPYFNSGAQDLTFGASPAGFVNNTEYASDLFITERYNTLVAPDNLQWDFPMPDGDYSVTLLFAEIGGVTAVGQRQFDVIIEGNTVLNDFDQIAVAGYNTAIAQTFKITVTGGNLDIDFVKVLGDVNIKGIEVIGFGNNPPVVTNPGTQNNATEDAVSLQIQATDGDDGSQTLSYEATNLPPGLEIDENTGLISGIIEDFKVNDWSFVEENGLVVMEAESVPIVDDWTEELDGVTYYTGGTDHFNDTDGGTLQYKIKIDLPGVYRFIYRTNILDQDLPSEHNDSWVKFTNSSNVHFIAAKGTFTEQDLIDNINGVSSDIDFYYAGGGGKFPVYPDASKNRGINGFFKAYRFGTGLKWQAATFDDDAHEIYAYFVNPGTYTLEISERSMGHKIDRIGLYKLSVYPDAIPFTLLNGSESLRYEQLERASAASPYNVNVTVTDNGNPIQESSVNFDWNITDNPNRFDISIKASLQFRPTNASGMYHVRLFDTGDLSAPVYDFNVYADNAGVMKLPNLISGGAYRLAVKRNSFLQRVEDININADGTVQVTNQLLAGDASGDNKVRILDFSILANSFNIKIFEPGYNPLVDFNLDTKINILDFSILATNFGLDGETE